MKRLLNRAVATLLVSLFMAPVVWACPHCRVEVRARTFSPDFASTALLLLLPLLVIAGVGAFLHVSDRPPGERHADRRHS